MDLDGSANTIVKEGNFKNIQLTSNYVFFQEFGTDIPLYVSPISSPETVYELQ